VTPLITLSLASTRGGMSSHVSRGRFEIAGEITVKRIFQAGSQPTQVKTTRKLGAHANFSDHQDPVFWMDLCSAEEQQSKTEQRVIKAS